MKHLQMYACKKDISCKRLQFIIEKKNVTLRKDRFESENLLQYEIYVVRGKERGEEDIFDSFDSHRSGHWNGR